MKKVLVTGAGGFAGQHVVAQLLKLTDWKIVALDRTGSSLPRESYRVRSVHDTLSGSMTSPWCENVDAVVHLAASSDVPEFLQDPYGHTMNNVMSTLSLLEWARHQNLQAFIQVSTNEVYGPASEEHSSREWDPLVPSTPYSASKACQEMLAIGWRQTYDVPVIIVNTMHLYGEGQPLQRFVPNTIAQILRGEKVTIFCDPVNHLSPVRNWTYVGDFARAIVGLLLRGVGPRSDERPDRWNVAGPQLSCTQVARKLGFMLECDFEVDFTSHDRPGYDFRYALDTRAFDALGFGTHYGIDEGLRRTVDYVKRELNLEA